MIWDIASGTGLAIQIDVLPENAPQGAMRGLSLSSSLSSSGHFQRLGNVAVLDITSVITPYPNILSALFGGTDIQSVAAQFQTAMDDSTIEGILLRIDSPGGLITGVEELSSTIAAARGTKPVVAYAYGNAASAAYWIASAADKIVAGPTTFLGSIGVAMAMPKDKDSRWVHFVSSNAPKKQMNPESEEGRDSIQRRIDAMEQEFVAAVASNRGVEKEKILSEFGQGDVLPAREAVQTGMADFVGGFHEALALINDLKPKTEGDIMNDQNKSAPPAGGGNVNMIQRDQITADFIRQDFPHIAQALSAEGQEEARKEDHKEGHKEGKEEAQKKGYDEGYKAGAEAEKGRILAIESVALPGHEDLVNEAKKDGKSTASDLALKMVAVEKKRGSAALQSMKQSAENQPDPGPSVDIQGTTASVDPDAPVEDRAKDEWEKGPQIRSEFGDLEAYQSFRKAEESGRVLRYATK